MRRYPTAHALVLQQEQENELKSRNVPQKYGASKKTLGNPERRDEKDFSHSIQATTARSIA
jgi:hypothetical protein